MAGVLSKSRLKVPSSQRDDSYSSSQRNDSHGTFHMTMNIPYNKENKGIYYSHSTITGYLQPDTRHQAATSRHHNPVLILTQLHVSNQAHNGPNRSGRGCL